MTIQLTDGTNTADYVTISTSRNEYIFRDDSSTLQNPRTLRVSHQVANSPDGVDRHLVQMVRNDDDEDGNPIQGSVHVVLAAPRTGVTKANLLLQWEMLRRFVDAQFDELYDGFPPTQS
jgi:hypothetical protein